MFLLWTLTYCLLLVLKLPPNRTSTRLFCIGFTRKQDMSTKKTAYAQAGQVRNIRKKMIDIMTREVSSTDLKDVVNKLIPDSIARDIEKACQGQSQCS
jgi:small subunit ribosomal protein S3Ae